MNVYIRLDDSPPKSKFALFFLKISKLITFVQFQQHLKNSFLHDFFFYYIPSLKGSIFSSLDEEIRKNNNLMKIIKTKYLCEFAEIGILRLVANLTMFTGPLFLDLLTNNLKDFGDGKDERDELRIWNLWFSLALAGCFLISIFLEIQYSWQLSRLETKLKATLQYLLYNKGLKLRMIESKEGDGNPNYTNMLTCDVDNITNYIQSFHQTWTQTVNLIIGLAYLGIKMNYLAVLIGFLLTFFLVIINFQIAKKIGSANEKLLQYKDQRINLFQDILAGIRQIKYLNWENQFIKKLLSIRDNEFFYLKVKKYLDAFCVFFWATLTIIISTIIFCLNDYLENNSVKKLNVFTAIALFNILLVPLNALPWTIGGMMTGKISMKRIGKFYAGKEIDNDVNTDEKNNSEIVLKIEDNTFWWPSNNTKTDFKLTNLNLNIMKGTLNMIIGPVGSGKTALLNVILNEMENEKNKQIKVNGKISYVSQNSWLRSLNIRENILFGKDFEFQFYNECLEKSELKEDLKKSEISDYQEIGSEGFKLSGGQKQRLCLSRALYNFGDLFLFDDIFSSVDAEVANSIFENAINSLISKGKTIILILSQHRFLKYADRVFLMKEGKLYEEEEIINEYLAGHVENEIKDEKKKVGSQYEEFKVFGTSIDHKKKKNNDKKIKNESKEYRKEEPCNIYEFNSDKLLLNKHDDKNNNFSENDNGENRGLNKETINLNGSYVSQEGSLENFGEEFREKGIIKFSNVSVYIKSMSFLFFFLILFTLFLMQFFKNFYDIWLNFYVSSEVFLMISDFRTSIIILAAISISVTLLRAFIFAYGNLRASRKIFELFLRKVLFAKISFFESTPPGQIINRFSNDMQSVDDGVSFDSNIFLNNVFIIFGAIVVIAIQNYYILIFFPIVGFLFYLVQKNYRVASREIKRLDSVNGSKVINLIVETARGIKTIRAHQKERFFNEQFKLKLIDNSCTGFLSKALSCWFSIRLRIISMLITISILSYNVYQVFYSMDEIDSKYASDFALQLSYSLTIPSLLLNLISSFTSTERECISIERINQYLQIEIEDLTSNNSKIENKINLNVAQSKQNKNNDSPKCNKITKNEMILENLNANLQINKESLMTDENYDVERNESLLKNDMSEPISFNKLNFQLTINTNESNDCALEFKNVWMKYDGGKDYVLKDINFKIRRNAKIAFVGRTGCGKTTILNALFRLYPIEKGDIFINNEDTSRLSLSSLRSLLSVVPQSGFLFQGTIGENLDPSGISSPKELNNIWNDFSSSLIFEIKKNQNSNKKSRNDTIKENDSDLNGIETEYNVASSKKSIEFKIEEGGRNLSNGEKQLINIIRVFLRSSEIICLDEATSNLDIYTEELINKAMKKMKNKTIVLITHKLENLKNFDVIYVMKKGKIVEEGNFKSLSEDEKSYFNRFLKNNKNT